MEKVFVATCDRFTSRLIKECVLSAAPSSIVFDGTDDNDLIYNIKSSGHCYLFFDKYFLSYILKYKINILKILNDKIKIIFCEQGCCSRYFGMRLFDIGADGYISNIENKTEFIEKLKLLFSGKKLFPEEVIYSLEKIDNLIERKNCTDITDKELEIGIYLGQGKSLKEVSSLVKINMNCLSVHLHRLKKKIGFKSINDFMLLNKQLEQSFLRSWNC